MKDQIKLKSLKTSLIVFGAIFSGGIILIQTLVLWYLMPSTVRSTSHGKAAGTAALNH